MRPGRLGIHVVFAERRDPAPVVNSGVQKKFDLIRRQIRRRLHVHRRSQHQPRGRNCAYHVVGVGLGRVGHRDFRLGAKILDDDFLDVAVTLVRVANCSDTLRALDDRFADTEQDAGRERDLQRAGVVYHLNTQRGIFVRRRLMNATARAKPRRDTLEHQAHAGVERTQRAHLIDGHQAGVGVRQQSLLDRDLACAPDVLDRGADAEFRERFTI